MQLCECRTPRVKDPLQRLQSAQCSESDLKADSSSNGFTLVGRRGEPLPIVLTSLELSDMARWAFAMMPRLLLIAWSTKNSATSLIKTSCRQRVRYTIMTRSSNACLKTLYADAWYHDRLAKNVRRQRKAHRPYRVPSVWGAGIPSGGLS